jgi:plasmid stabilization system protein ParE
MAFGIEWTRPALEQLHSILTQLREVQPRIAEAFGAELNRRVDRLAQFPRSGALYARRRGFEVRQITYRKYRIFFRVRPRLKRVEVLSVWHGARQEPRFRRS